MFSAMSESTTGLVSHQPSQQALVPRPSFPQPQVASSVAPSTQTLQPPQQASQVGSAMHPTLVLSTGPTMAPPLSRASSWYTTPQASGDQGYVSPLIDLYSESNLDMEALYDSPAD